jgi:hypothetical protein
MNIVPVTQAKNFDLDSADPCGSSVAVNLLLEICQLKCSKWGESWYTVAYLAFI